MGKLAIEPTTHALPSSCVVVVPSLMLFRYWTLTPLTRPHEVLSLASTVTIGMNLRRRGTRTCISPCTSHG